MLSWYLAGSGTKNAHPNIDKQDGQDTQYFLFSTFILFILPIHVKIGLNNVRL
jgi:hypothetical protein